MKSSFDNFGAVVELVGSLSSIQNTFSSAKNSGLLVSNVMLMPVVAWESTGRLEVVWFVGKLDSFRLVSSGMEILADLQVSNSHETTVPAITISIVAVDGVWSASQFTMDFVLCVPTSVWSACADLFAWWINDFPSYFSSPSSCLEMDISWSERGQKG